MHHVLTTLAAAALLTSGCHHAAAPVVAPPTAAATARDCPADLGANPCSRYLYFMNATDTLVAGLPTDPEAQRAAATSMSPTDCTAAVGRLNAWATAHQAELAAIAAGGSLTVEDQHLLRYGADLAHPRFDIDQRINLITRDLTCDGLHDAAVQAGLDTPTGWQDGVLGMSDYKSPN